MVLVAVLRWEKEWEGQRMRANKNRRKKKKTERKKIRKLNASKRNIAPYNAPEQKYRSRARTLCVDMSVCVISNLILTHVKIQR